MPRTVTKTETQYRFHELSPEAKIAVRYTAAFSEYHHDSDAMRSLEAFAEHFGSRLANWSIDWSNSSYSSAEFSAAELTVAELSERFSRLGEFNPETLQGVGECKLTGYCYDEDCIDGARAWFMSQPEPADASEPLDLAPMFEAGFRRWLAAVHEDYEYQQSDEALAETCEANDYWFTEGGKLA